MGFERACNAAHALRKRRLSLRLNINGICAYVPDPPNEEFIASWFFALYLIAGRVSSLLGVSLSRSLMSS